MRACTLTAAVTYWLHVPQGRLKPSIPSCVTASRSLNGRVPLRRSFALADGDDGRRRRDDPTAAAGAA